MLETGYQPQSIVLEPTWKLGHTEKGRLDILVKKDEKAYLMIECKTHGKEYNKELKNLHKDGGQLFSYFQQDRDAEILMLYTFDIQKGETTPQCEIIKIEEEYRLTSSVKDFYEKWNKLTKNNGVWENPPYNFKPKALTIEQLVDIKHEDSSFLACQTTRPACRRTIAPQSRHGTAMLGNAPGNSNLRRDSVYSSGHQLTNPSASPFPPRKARQSSCHP